jgi:Tat protein secretion system quality control protein TatD with DNase activity
MDVGAQSLARYLTDLKIKIIRSGTIREKRHENCRLWAQVPSEDILAEDWPRPVLI